MSAHYVSAIVAKTVVGFKDFLIINVGYCLGSEVLMLTGDSVPVSVFVSSVLVFVGVSTHYVCTYVAKTVVGFKLFLYHVNKFSYRTNVKGWSEKSVFVT